MKSKIFYSLLGIVLAIAGVLTAFKAAPEYHISGSVNGLSSGRIYLI